MNSLTFANQALKYVWLSLVEFTKKPSSRNIAERQQTSGYRQKPVGLFTLEEVAKHSTTSDCWVVIRNKVYDVTEFGQRHPGGKVIFALGGRDTTEHFTAFHSGETWDYLKNFYIGDIQPSQRSGELEVIQDFRKLRAEFVSQGLFKSDKIYYVNKTSMNLSIFLTAFAVLYSNPNSLAIFFLAAFLLALFWQQMGWLSHDFIHHQVFKNRWWNNFYGYIFGNILQGFSVDWWKNKHNTHHAVTNEITDSKLAIDPDIDTLPVLAWSIEMLDGLQDSSMRIMIKYQHYLFFPVLMFARFSWAQQSFSHATDIAFKANGSVFEISLLLIHYALHLGLTMCALPIAQAILFISLAQVMCGFMLGLSFVQSHNGMEIYLDIKDFVSSQVVSTRDISHSTFVDWFMGGLNYQIEHHLFPTMPRHNLRKTQEKVRALCEKHNLAYEECSMPIGTKRVVQRLIDVARQI